MRWFCSSSWRRVYVWAVLTNVFRTMDTQHTGRVNLNLFLACISVHDLKVDITWQGYPTPTFTVYRKENLNLSIVPPQGYESILRGFHKSLPDPVRLVKMDILAISVRCPSGSLPIPRAPGQFSEPVRAPVCRRRCSQFSRRFIQTGSP